MTNVITSCKHNVHNFNEFPVTMFILLCSCSHFDAITGKPLGTSGKSLKHHTELLTIALDHRGPPATRQLILLDKNHDLYITPVRSFVSTSKMTGIG